MRNSLIFTVLGGQRYNYLAFGLTKRQSSRSMNKKGARMKEKEKWKKDKRQGVKAERGALVSPPLGWLEREFRLFV